MSFDNAALKCQEMGLRLCTKDELQREVCCGMGGGCDNYLMWTSTLERYYVDDGCQTAGDSPNGSFQPKSYQAGVRCCSNDGESCQTPFDCPNNKLSFDDAAYKCQEMGLRLCTKDELQREVCCGMGGGCDNYLMWTSTLESGMYLSV